MANTHRPTRFDRALSELLQAMSEPTAEFPEVHARIACRFVGIDAAALADAYDAATVSNGPLTAQELTNADQLTRAHTAFDSFADMLDAGGAYAPSIHCGARNDDTAERTQLRELANLYDRAQAARGDARRAYRY